MSQKKHSPTFLLSSSHLQPSPPVTITVTLNQHWKALPFSYQAAWFARLTALVLNH